MINKFFKIIFGLQNPKSKFSISSRTDFFELLKDSSWLFSANSIIYFLAFIQGILVARYLGVNAYGIFGLITLYVLTINQIFDSRVWETVIKYSTKFLEQKSYNKASGTITIAYLTDLSTGFIAFVIVLITAPLAATLLTKDTSYTSYIRLYAVTLLLMIPQDTSSAVVKTARKYNWLANQSLLEAVFRFIGVIFVITVNGNIEGLIFVYLATAILSTTSLVIMSYKAAKTLYLSIFKLSAIKGLSQEYREMFRFLLLTNGQALLKLIREADALIVGFFLTPYDVGLYRVAKNTVALMYFPITPIYITSYPKFNSLWQSNKISELKILIRHLWKTFTAIGLIELIAMWVFGGVIIVLTVGESYSEAKDVLNWLALGTAISISVNFGYPLLISSGDEKRAFVSMAFGTLLQILLLIITLPTIGLIGAGVSNLAFQSFWAFIIFRSRKSIGENG